MENFIILKSLYLCATLLIHYPNTTRLPCPPRTVPLLCHMITIALNLKLLTMEIKTNKTMALEKMKMKLIKANALT